MVITQDFEFCDPGSSPGRTCIFILFFDSIDFVQMKENKKFTPHHIQLTIAYV